MSVLIVRRFLSLLLAAVLLYALGAGSCGCAEHNCWMALFNSKSAAANSHGHEHGAPCKPVHESVTDSHDCDSGLPDYFVIGKCRTKSERSVQLFFGVYADISAAQSNGRSARDTAADQRCLNAAPAVRADLQVFLL